MCIFIRIVVALFFSFQEDEKKEPEEPEPSRKLFIGVVSCQMTSESLKAYFEKGGGGIVDVAVMKDPKTNKYVLVWAQIKFKES
jgi:hypothetical protein